MLPHKSLQRVSPNPGPLDGNPNPDSLDENPNPDPLDEEELMVLMLLIRTRLVFQAMIIMFIIFLTF